METMDITDEEKARIPQQEGDSLLGVYNQFLKLRKTLEFHQVVGRSEAHKARHHGNEVYSNINDGVRNSSLYCLTFGDSYNHLTELLYLHHSLNMHQQFLPLEMK